MKSVWHYAFTAGNRSLKDGRRVLEELVERGDLEPDDPCTRILASALLPRKEQVTHARTNEAWVARAVCENKEGPEWIHYCWAKDGILVATDGYRAHRANTGLVDGAYSINGRGESRAQDVDSQTPESVFALIDRVWPEVGGAENLVYEDVSVDSRILIHVNGGRVFNYELLRAAEATEGTFVRFGKHEHSAVQFDIAEERTAIIMPAIP